MQAQARYTPLAPLNTCDTAVGVQAMSRDARSGSKARILHRFQSRKRAWRCLTCALGRLCSRLDGGHPAALARQLQALWLEALNALRRGIFCHVARVRYKRFSRLFSRFTA